MSPPTPDLFALFCLGAVTGTTLCTFSCLAYLGPLLVGGGNGGRAGLWSGLQFAGGKVAAYSGLAALAGAGGLGFLPTPRHAALLTGAGLLLLAAGLVRRPTRCAGNRQRWSAWPLFGLGLVSGLTPCPTLAGLLGMAAGSGSPARGALVGLAFGCGLLLSPLLPAAAGLGHLGGRLRQEVAVLAVRLRQLCAGLLVIVSLRLLFGL